jgi:hypothetical protein
MAGKIRTLGPGIFKITDTENGRDFSADLTKAQLNPSNSSDDPTTYLDGSEETNTTTTWTFEGTVGDDFSEDGLAVWLFDHKGETLPAQSSRTIPARSSGPSTSPSRQSPSARRQIEEHERSELRRHERRPRTVHGQVMSDG